MNKEPAPGKEKEKSRRGLLVIDPLLQDGDPVAGPIIIGDEGEI